MKKQKILITTAIDYTNDVIHVGQAYEKVLADCIARYYRNKLGKENVYFLTGTDNHGTTNEKAAIKNNKDPAEYVEEISEKDKEQIDALLVEYDRFIKTTDEDHKKVATDFFAKAVETGDVYEGVYKGYYCEGCESHKTHSELTEEGQCPLHKTRQIQKLDEKNYFFKWSKYSKFLKELIESETFLLPRRKRNEMLSFIENGLEDIPVSRPKEKVSWGITAPNDETQVLYVWYDALVNYYTAASQTGFWNEETHIVHFVGKDILRFHTLLWPAMLENVGYKLPDTVYAHGFITLDGEKISKSRGNVIRPKELTDTYGTDAVRYYLLKRGPIVEDADISLSNLEEVYNAELANGIGNTFARITKLAENSGFSFKSKKIDTNIWDEEWSNPIKDYRADLALQNVWKRLSQLDKHVNENEPWAIKEEERLKEVLEYEVSELRNIAKIVEPFIPNAAKTMQKVLSKSKIKGGTVLFPRLNK